ncbi:hypothetical protein GCM10010121_007290 [Streptomyces brasiliensis]|uniref:Uncharacterized protein n=1 Tax=Streptomyces brasiliensis TaxID=1954 RepID=A0A917K6B8_9ACTN|nr:hypothetical protein GCM10010121_007290 [Streptomyces brasiliensis]
MRTVTVVGAFLSGLHAARELLAGRTLETARSVPYFWSDQYGARIRFAGRRRDGDAVRVAESELTGDELAEGALGERAQGETGFLGRYERDGRTVAVLSVDRRRPFVRARRELARRESPVEPAAL